jgi:hypothetical protein
MAWQGWALPHQILLSPRRTRRLGPENHKERTERLCHSRARGNPGFSSGLATGTNNPVRPSAAAKTFSRRDAEAQRPESHNHLSCPASLRLCARHNSSGFHDLRDTPAKICAGKQDLKKVVDRYRGWSAGQAAGSRMRIPCPSKMESVLEAHHLLDAKCHHRTT